MNSDAAAGGAGLAVIALLMVAAAVIAAIVWSKAWAGVQRFDRSRAVEREVRDQYIDANVAQKAARKLLDKHSS